MTTHRLTGSERALVERMLAFAAATVGDELTIAVRRGDPGAIDAAAARGRRLGRLAEALQDGVVTLDAALLTQLRAWRGGVLELVAGEREGLAEHLGELAACDTLLERAAAHAHLRAVDA